MFLSDCTKSGFRIASNLGFVALNNILLVNSAHAFYVTFTNGDFENLSDNLANWSTIGDVSTNTGIDGISPTSPSNQAIITNAHSTRIDDIDSSSNSLSFNQSGTNPVDADTLDPGNSDLQTQLGLSTDSFSISRENASANFASDPRTSKEGSAIYQDFQVTLNPGETEFQVSFNWAYLTNDGNSSTFGDQDFAFFTVGSYDSGTDTYTPNLNSGNDIEVLSDSGSALNNPSSDNDFFHEETTYYQNSSNTYNYSVTGFSQTSPTTYDYRVSVGVVDVDGSDRSSALLVDNFNVQQVPFKFSPALGIFIVGGMIGCDLMRRKLKVEN